jgi:hypothetical protein
MVEVPSLKVGQKLKSTYDLFLPALNQIFNPIEILGSPN